MVPIICKDCGQDGGLLALSGPCLDCARARQKAAMSGRCSCPKRLRRESKVKRVGSRSWVGCDRCFGSVRQLS
jgi:hypothetical protein